jgi:transglutaminase-like putative cysteine protease
MWIRTTCNLNFQMGDPTPLILMLRPRSGMQQWVAREVYTLSPSVPVVEYTDIFGNLCQRLVAPAGDFSVHTTADVLTADRVDADPGVCFVEIQNLPDAVLLYLLPSRYCESDRFGNLARDIVEDARLGYDQVSRISDWVRDTIRYTPGSSAFPLSAVEVNGRCEGVCRDLAHLGIALCRGISIPARLVVGFLRRWICTPGSRRTLAIVGIRLTPPRNRFVAGGWRWPTGVMRPMFPCITSLVHRQFTAAWRCGWNC